MGSNESQIAIKPVEKFTSIKPIKPIAPQPTDKNLINIDPEATQKYGETIYWLDVVPNREFWDCSLGRTCFTVSTHNQNTVHLYLYNKNPDYARLYNYLKISNPQFLNATKCYFKKNYELVDVALTTRHESINEICGFSDYSNDLKDKNDKQMSRVLIKDPIKVNEKYIMLFIETERIAALTLNTKYNIKFRNWSHDFVRYIVTDISVDK